MTPRLRSRVLPALLVGLAVPLLPAPILAQSPAADGPVVYVRAGSLLDVAVVIKGGEVVVDRRDGETPTGRER